MEGKGGKTRVVPAGEPAWRALERYLDRGRTALALRERERAGAVPVEERAAAVHLRRAPALRSGLARPRLARRRLPSHPASLVRHPSARGRGRSAGDPGTAGACRLSDDPDLHSGRVGAPQEGVRARSPARLTAGHMETNLKAIELKELWRRYKDDARREGARATCTRLLAAGQVRRRPHVERPALPRRGVRPDLLRPAGADLGDRALRSRARDQVRDVRDHPHQGLDHRRAALARLGAALGAREGARDRADEREARARAAPGADRRRRWPRRWR